MSQVHLFENSKDLFNALREELDNDDVIEEDFDISSMLGDVDNNRSKEQRGKSRTDDESSDEEIFFEKSKKNWGSKKSMHHKNRITVENFLERTKELATLTPILPGQNVVPAEILPDDTVLTITKLDNSVSTLRDEAVTCSEESVAIEKILQGEATPDLLNSTALRNYGGLLFNSNELKVKSSRLRDQTKDAALSKRPQRAKNKTFPGPLRSVPDLISIHAEKSSDQMFQPVISNVHSIGTSPPNTLPSSSVLEIVDHPNRRIVSMSPSRHVLSGNQENGPMSLSEAPVDTAGSGEFQPIISNVHSVSTQENVTIASLKVRSPKILLNVRPPASIPDTTKNADVICKPPRAKTIAAADSNPLQLVISDVHSVTLEQNAATISPVKRGDVTNDMACFNIQGTETSLLPITAERVSSHSDYTRKTSHIAGMPAEDTADFQPIISHVQSVANQQNTTIRPVSRQSATHKSANMNLNSIGPRSSTIVPRVKETVSLQKLRPILPKPVIVNLCGEVEVPMIRTSTGGITTVATENLMTLRPVVPQILGGRMHIAARSKPNRFANTRPLNQVTKPLNEVTKPSNEVTRPLNKVTIPLNEVTRPLNEIVTNVPPKTPLEDLCAEPEITILDEIPVVRLAAKPCNPEPSKAVVPVIAKQPATKDRVQISDCDGEEIQIVGKPTVPLVAKQVAVKDMVPKNNTESEQTPLVIKPSVPALERYQIALKDSMQENNSDDEQLQIVVEPYVPKVANQLGAKDTVGKKNTTETEQVPFVVESAVRLLSKQTSFKDMVAEEIIINEQAPVVTNTNLPLNLNQLVTDTAPNNTETDQIPFVVHFPDPSKDRVPITWSFGNNFPKDVLAQERSKKFMGICDELFSKNVDGILIDLDTLYAFVKNSKAFTSFRKIYGCSLVDDILVKLKSYPKHCRIPDDVAQSFKSDLKDLFTKDFEQHAFTYFEASMGFQLEMCIFCLEMRKDKNFLKFLNHFVVDHVFNFFGSKKIAYSRKIIEIIEKMKKTFRYMANFGSCVLSFNINKLLADIVSEHEKVSGVFSRDWGSFIKHQMKNDMKSQTKKKLEAKAKKMKERLKKKARKTSKNTPKRQKLIKELPKLNDAEVLSEKQNSTAADSTTKTTHSTDDGRPNNGKVSKDNTENADSDDDCLLTIDEDSTAVEDDNVTEEVTSPRESPTLNNKPNPENSKRKMESKEPLNPKRKRRKEKSSKAVDKKILEILKEAKKEIEKEEEKRKEIEQLSKVLKSTKTYGSTNTRKDWTPQPSKAPTKILKTYSKKLPESRIFYKDYVTMIRMTSLRNDKQNMISIIKPSRTYDSRKAKQDNIKTSDSTKEENLVIKKETAEDSVLHNLFEYLGPADHEEMILEEENSDTKDLLNEINSVPSSSTENSKVLSDEQACTFEALKDLSVCECKDFFDTIVQSKLDEPIELDNFLPNQRSTVGSSNQKAASSISTDLVNFGVIPSDFDSNSSDSSSTETPRVEACRKRKVSNDLPMSEETKKICVEGDRTGADQISHQHLDEGVRDVDNSLEDIDPLRIDVKPEPIPTDETQTCQALGLIKRESVHKCLYMIHNFIINQCRLHYDLPPAQILTNFKQVGSVTKFDHQILQIILINLKNSKSDDRQTLLHRTKAFFDEYFESRRGTEKRAKPLTKKQLRQILWKMRLSSDAYQRMSTCKVSLDKLSLASVQEKGVRLSADAYASFTNNSKQNNDLMTEHTMPDILDFVTRNS